MDTHELKRMVGAFRNIYEGAAWHGDTIRASLDKVKVANITKRIGNSHNIMELVLHITTWRTFAVQRLMDNDAFEVDDALNFTPIHQADKKDWQQVLDLLESSQRSLVEALEALTDDAKLREKVKGKKYSFHTLLHGVLQHDIYHLGQIVMLNKLT